MAKTTTLKPSIPSSNWLALKKTLPKAVRKRESSQELPRKRRKIQHSRSRSPRSSPDAVKVPPAPQIPVAESSTSEETMKNGESIPTLRRMILGQVEYSDVQRQPGKYLALDCEMVGVGPEGVESALARVSLVNFYGAVQLDEFVRPRERVADYRTEFSGIREKDMVHAKPLETVQTLVAALLKDRILVGHAVHNDLKALLLSHPHTATRDTQYYAGKSGLVKSKRIALRKLVQQEVGATIQGGEHSSVTDARATMAVYRLHRKEWEKLAPTVKSGVGVGVSGASSVSASKKGKQVALPLEKREEGSDEDEDADDDSDDASPATTPKSNPKPKPSLGRKLEKAKEKIFPGGGRKGVSSGLSTVVRRGKVSGGGGGGGGGGDAGRAAKKNMSTSASGSWWKELGSGSGGSKGSVVVRTRT
ncbi:exonuclease domain-containing protein [Favolaschia claudopus]|uniref:RNA exonuclease 4 n=1 Tax=Favolaschia claudopus TaxID=2862362 RepID=A0AAW0DYU4_9AGAR